MSDFYQKIVDIQATLNAPKGQWNKFGKYAYRNCEDILEALKPLLKKHGLAQFISDEIVEIGGRFYIKSTVRVTDGSTTETNTAYAREEENKKGMDAAQLTGATSSYARKYALNGMWDIDDNKDPDSSENHEQRNANKNQQQHQQVQMINHAQQVELKKFIEDNRFTVEQVTQFFNIQSLAQVPANQFENTKNTIKGWIEK